MYKILFKEEAIPSWYELLILMLFFLLGIFTLCVISIQVLIYGWPLEQVNIFATIISTLSVQVLVWRGVGHFPLSMHSLDATQHPLFLAAAKNPLDRLGVHILRLQRLSFTLLSTHMSPSVFLLSIFLEVD